MGVMTELQKALAAFQRELNAASAASPGSVPWRIDRIHLRLGLEWVPGVDGQGVWRPAMGASSHAVDLDWIRGEGIVSEVEPVCASTLGTTATNGDGTPMMQRLEAAFGPPGFDSAARATVFREVALEVGLDALVELLEALVGKRTVPDAGIERARQSVMRLLERGPAGVTPGAAILLDVFRQFPEGLILESIGSRWRYGTGHDLEGGR